MLASYPPPAFAAPPGSPYSLPPGALPGPPGRIYPPPGTWAPYPPPPKEPPPVAPIEGRRPPLWLPLLLIGLLMVPAFVHWATRQPDVVITDAFTQVLQVRELVVCAVLLVIMVAFRYSRSVGWVPRPGAGTAVRVIAAGLVVTAFVAATAAALDLGLPTRVLLIVLVNVVAVGVAEETLFRGFLWAALPESWSTSRVLLVTSVVFGSVHVLNGLVTGNWRGAVAQAAGAMVLGLTLGAVRMRSGWLMLGVVAHAAIDAASAILAQFAPRLADTAHPPVGPLLPLLVYFGFYVTFAFTGIVVLVRTFRSERRARRAAAPPAAYPGYPPTS
jgi:membrane protease YdiL (CAAX protease family)